MPLDFTVVGKPLSSTEVSWTSDDTMLYALGVGAGQDDPLSELHYTTENSQDVTLQALPTFGAVLARRARRPRLGDVPMSRVLHAEQSLTVHTSLPASGTATVTPTVTGIYDKGTGALVVTETAIADSRTRKPLMTSTSRLFIRGEGGFGGAPPATSEWPEPSGDPHQTIPITTRPDQALLYRLTGDRNRLHSDPHFAVVAGFPKPILHGMCIYGIVCRVLINTLCAGSPARVKAIAGRFRKPVFPGTRLHLSVWHHPDGVQFVAHDDAGDVVLAQGSFGLSAP
jgi:acyl dehydratase